jgi:hypothetical protein
MRNEELTNEEKEQRKEQSWVHFQKMVSFKFDKEVSFSTCHGPYYI